MTPPVKPSMLSNHLRFISRNTNTNDAPKAVIKPCKKRRHKSRFDRSNRFKPNYHIIHESELRFFSATPLETSTRSPSSFVHSILPSKSNRSTAWYMLPSSIPQSVQMPKEFIGRIGNTADGKLHSCEGLTRKNHIPSVPECFLEHLEWDHRVDQKVGALRTPRDDPRKSHHQCAPVPPLSRALHPIGSSTYQPKKTSHSRCFRTVDKACCSPT